MAGVLNLVKTPGFWVCAGLGPFQKKENDGLFERMTTENVNSEKRDHWKCEFSTENIGFDGFSMVLHVGIWFFHKQK